MKFLLGLCSATSSDRRRKIQNIVRRNVTRVNLGDCLPDASAKHGSIAYTTVECHK